MGDGFYVKNSYKYKNIASIFFLVNILAFLYKASDFLLVLIRTNYIMKTIKHVYDSLCHEHSGRRHFID